MPGAVPGEPWRLLDQIDAARIESPLLAAAPLADARLALDAASPAASWNDGRAASFVLALPLRCDELGQPHRLAFERAGAPLTEPPFRVTVHRARQEFELASLPGFAFDSVSKADDRRLAAVITTPGTRTITVPRAGPAVHATLQCWFKAPGRTRNTIRPRFTLQDAELRVLATIEPGFGGRARFELPPTTGTTTLTLVCEGLVAGGEVMARFGTLLLEAVDGRDRVVLESETAALDLQGVVLRHSIAPPAAALPLPFAAPGALRLLVPGRATVLVEPPQPFALWRDGEPFGDSRNGVLDFAIDLPALRTLELRAPTGAALTGAAWLLQPDAAFALLHDPAAIREGALPPLRGRESEEPSPCVRHATLGDETRRCLLLPPGARCEFPLPAAADGAAFPTLRFALGHAALATGPTAPPPPTLTIELVAADGTTQRLSSEPLAATGRFVEQTLALPEASARGGARLRFAASAATTPAGATTLLLLAEPTLLPRERAARPNVLLYLVDTLRADRCSPWRTDRDTTPHLARVAAEGVLFERCSSSAPWTRPAVATLFSGVLPSYHGAGAGSGLSHETSTLAERLRAAGLATAAFVSNPQVSGRTLAFEQGFQTLVTFGRAGEEESLRAEVLTDRVIDWLDRNDDQPFFLYVHTLDPHAPYAPPPATAGRFARDYRGELTPALTTDLERRAPLSPADLRHVNDLYDEELLYADAEFGRLCDHLRRIGAWNDTLVVFVSDHGEEFADHGAFGHGRRLWEELLHVPLVMKPDRRDDESGAGTRIAAPTRLVDVPATILARVGGAIDRSDLMGSDLSGAFRGEAPPEQDSVAEYWNRSRRMTALRAGRFKLIRSVGEGDVAPLLFDLDADPREQHDLAAARPEVAARLLERLAATFSEWDRAGFARHDSRSESFTAEEAAALRALGYLDGGAPEAEDGDGR